MDRKLFTLIEIAVIAGLILAVLYFGGMFEKRPKPTAPPVDPTRTVVQPSPTPAPTTTLDNHPGPGATTVSVPTTPPLTQPTGLIAFESTRDGNHEIYVMHVEDALRGTGGSPQINLTRHPADDYLLSWSPDGRRIAFFSSRTGWLELFLMDADGSNVVQLTDTRATNTAYTASVSWSPDSQYLLAMRTTPWQLSNDPVPWALDLIPADGTGAATLFESQDTWLGQASISPDGAYVAATMLSDIGYGLYTARLETNSLAFRMIDDECSRFAWLPRTSTLTCTNGIYLFEINSDGTNRSSRKTNPMQDIARSLALSPDGSHLLVTFTSYPAGNSSSQVISLVTWNGRETRRQTLLSGMDVIGNVSWAPDSQWVAFAYRDEVGERTVGIFNIYNPLDGPRLTDSGDNFAPQWQPQPPTR